MRGWFRRNIGVLLGLGALALLLAGCSKCADFWWEKKAPQSCRAGPAPN
jgi:hypothetical protein